MILPRSSMIFRRAERCRYDDYYEYCYYSPWDTWGRWVFLAGIVIFFLLIFLVSCLSARRRRRAGLSPLRGTAWLAGKPPPGHGPAVYTGGQPQYGQPHYGQPHYGQPVDSQPAPPYAAPPTNAYYGNSAGYTGAGAGYYAAPPQQSGIELQTPPGTYQPQAYQSQTSEPVYAPPPGPPPSHVK